MPRTSHHAPVLLVTALLLGACGAPAPAEPAGSTAAGGEAPATQSPAAVDLPGAREAVPGVLTGGKPSPENLQQAKDAGYRSVVSLLPGAAGSDEAAAVTALGMRFVSIPVAGGDDLTEANARLLAEVLGDAAARPVIVHCGSGNRAGGLLALHAHFVEGKPAEAALQLGLDAGLTGLTPVVRERLGLPVAP